MTLGRRRRQLNLLAAQQQFLLRHLELQERLDRERDGLLERERAVDERQRQLDHLQATGECPARTPHDVGQTG